MSSSPSFLDPVVLARLAGQSVLDAGCGYGRWAALISSNFWEAGLEEPPAVDGFDAFEPNVERCRASGNYRRVWVQRMPGELDGEWDTVLASELLEHLEPDEVDETLTTLERSARRRVILTTPNWPAYRPGSDTPLGFNEFEAHRSYMSRKELRARGYRLRGAGMLYRPGRLTSTLRRLQLARAFDSLPYAVPALGDLVVAFKDV
jgi:SAM-dependent methyltransferase